MKPSTAAGNPDQVQRAAGRAQLVLQPDQGVQSGGVEQQQAGEVQGQAVVADEVRGQGTEGLQVP